MGVGISLRGLGFGRPLALSACLIGLCAAQRAQASETYPPKVQEAMMKRLNASYCVPQCILCHLTNQGGIGTLNPFGKNLQRATVLLPRRPDTVAQAFETYLSTQANADSDMDGTSDVKELEIGDSPAVAGVPGTNLICPDIRYGCGARIASAPPPVDHVGLFAAGLVVLGITLLRRKLWLKNAS
jgi:hypothetical protein